jgi:hypothetical protein
MKIIRQDNPNSHYKYRYGYYNDSGRFITHREDGPAVQTSQGIEIWYYENMRHRQDGPAWLSPNQYPVYFFRDKYIPASTQEEFEKWLKYNNF